MGLFRKTTKTDKTGDPTSSPKTVVAASIPLAGPDKITVGRNFKAGQEDWQNQAWYHYDACGEFRSAVGWIANAVSKAAVHAAVVDTATGEPGEPAEDERVQRIAAAVLGGAEVRPGLLRMLAVQWQVPGESFVLVRGRSDGPDEWMVFSGRRMVYKGSQWTYTDPRTLLKVVVNDTTDRLMRVWSPHPDDPVQADSAARPGLPILREIEKASQAIAARLDSRLATAGVHAIPSETVLPAGSEAGTVSEALTDLLMDAAAENIKNPGQSAARVPIFVEMPGDQIANFAQGLIDYATDFDGSVVELRADALRRLAATLDMPNETAEGSTGGMNHWGSWQVEESTYKIYIEPLLGALGDALTRDWFRPALLADGIRNPERYVLNWDTSSIVARPDRTAELERAWDDVLISDDYRRQQAGIPEEAAPSEEERTRRLLEKIVLAQPSILADPGVPAALGMDIQITPSAVGVAEEPEETEPEETEPEESQTPALPAAPGARPDDEDDVPEGLVAAAELIVYDALSRAGARLLTRQHRGQFGTMPRHELYLHISPPAEDGARAALLEGSFQFTDRVALTFGRDVEHFHRRLTGYVAVLLRNQDRHDRSKLRNVLR